MWPRLIAQLVELLPHATRLLPMADNYLSVRRESDRSQSTALTSMSDELHGELSRVTSTYTGLSKQVTEQSAQIVSLKDGVALLQTSSTLQTKQLEWITTDVNTLRVWVKFGTVTIIVLLIAVVALMVQLLHGR